MAIIKCVECKNEISSFAPACPYCGCPSEYQTTQYSSSDTDAEIRENELGFHKLKYQDQWEDILELVERDQVHDALHKAKALVGKMNVGRIIADMATNHKIPVDLIIERFPDQVAPMSSKSSVPITTCTACSRPISTKAETCPHCGNPTGVHVCPKCGSTNTYVISRVDKAAMTFMFGRYAAHNVMAKYGCEDCKYTF